MVVIMVMKTIHKINLKPYKQTITKPLVLVAHKVALAVRVPFGGGGGSGGARGGNSSGGQHVASNPPLDTNILGPPGRTRGGGGFMSSRPRGGSSSNNKSKAEKAGLSSRFYEGYESQKKI